MLLALFAAGAAQLVEPAPLSAVNPSCNRTVVHARGVDPAQSRKLGRLPPGQLQLAVNKRVGGCSVTVLPIRDANGHHVMTPGADPEVRPADRSLSQRGSQRQR